MIMFGKLYGSKNVLYQRIFRYLCGWGSIAATVHCNIEPQSLEIQWHCISQDVYMNINGMLRRETYLERNV